MAARKKGKSKGKVRRTTATKGAVATAIDMGQQIWLAGLGALVRTQREGPKLFESLVEEGGEVQARQRATAQHLMKGAWEDLRDKVETRTAGVRSKANDTLENLEVIFQTRVQKALQQLGMPTSQEIGALSRKVNELNRSVKTLTRGKGAATSRKTATPAAAAGEEAVF